MRRTSLKLKHWNSFAMLKNVLMMLKQFQCFISVLFHHVRRALDDGQPKRDPCMIHTQSHRLMLSSFNSARSRRASEMWMYYVNIFVNLELVIEVTLLDVNWWSFFGIGCVDPGGQYFAKGAMHQSCPPIITLQNIHPCESVIKIMKCPYCLNCPKFGQLGLIIRKIIRIVATRCQIFLVKNVQNSISLRPRPHFGSLQCPLTFWLHLRGPTVKGREKGWSKKGVCPQPPNLHHRSTPLEIETFLHWKAHFSALQKSTGNKVTGETFKFNIREWISQPTILFYLPPCIKTKHNKAKIANTATGCQKSQQLMNLHGRP